MKPKLPLKHQRARAGAVREAMRDQLPLDQYLNVLHSIAVCGEMPVLDPVTGRDTGTRTQVSTEQRIQTTRYLVDKILPTASRVEISTEHVTSPEAKAALMQNPDALRTMTLDQLTQALTLSIETSTEPDPAPEVYAPVDHE